MSKPRNLTGNVQAYIKRLLARFSTTVVINFEGRNFQNSSGQYLSKSRPFYKPMSHFKF